MITQARLPVGQCFLDVHDVFISAAILHPKDWQQLAGELT